jgi:hypothetical protein
MYDGTNVALAVGGLFSMTVGFFSLIAAVVSLAYFVAHKLKNSPALLSGRLAVFFVIAAVLSGISVVSGFGTYDLFEHQRGRSGSPEHVIAVTIATVSVQQPRLLLRTLENLWVTLFPFFC